MPLVRIDLARGKTEHYRHTIGDVVYEAMRETLNVPEDDRFQIISEHGEDDFIIDRGYLGVRRTDDVVVIQVTQDDFVVSHGMPRPFCFNHRKMRQRPHSIYSRIAIFCYGSDMSFWHAR